MKLGTLLGTDSTSEVTGFAIDHRKVAPGTIFGAFQGAKVNGEDYVSAAIAAGAVAIVARPGVAVDGAVHVAAENPRREFAHLAARYFAPFPDHLVAVTGTNGKTSTVELTRQLWRMSGLSAASIGTLGITTSDEQVVTGLTTPDVATFLSNLAGLKREGVSHVAFEASSHGLDQFRIEGIRVSAAAFTNLSRDHLDYHGTMEAYFAAKIRLFTELVEEGGTAVIWADDVASNDVKALARKRGLKISTVGVRGETLKLIERNVGHLGQNIIVEAEGKTYKIALPLIGAYQVANALTAAGLVIAAGGDVATTLSNLARVQGVRGRIERAVITKSGAPVYVDYAHTPDALEAAVAALRPHAKGRILLVFGAGGDRDPGKRREMGAIAVRDADVAIVTDDNPRTEDPAIIRRAIMAAAPGATEIGDRRAAIAAAIAMAKPDDIVLIAGKGHETGQEINGIKHPFNDVEVARECAA
jgi:UDP-N-acetylmuramoyl-L-alanyl-D-glutamate--2,6-diaminopimelate ligase